MADKNSFGPLKDVPFTFFSLECPVCGQVNEYKKIKSGAFVEAKIDTDFCPQERIWTFPENQNLHPYLFLLLTERQKIIDIWIQQAIIVHQFLCSAVVR